MKTKSLIKQLAARIAAEEIRFQLTLYKEDAAFFADEGVTERQYLVDAEEQLESQLEDVREVLDKMTSKEYKRLIKEKYKR